jgi:hypothetical protein
MIWKSIVSPRAIAPASARWSGKTAAIISEFASIAHNLVADVRDSYRPELHYMRGPGPKWRAKQLSPVYIRRPDAANPIR